MAEGVVMYTPSARQFLHALLRRTNLPLRAWAYWAAIVAPAGVAVVASFVTRPDDGWNEFALLTAAAAIAQLTSLQLTRNRVFHPSVVFVVAGALMLTPQQLVLMCALHNIPDWLKQRYAWYIAPFNIANYVVAGALACATARGVAAAGLAPAIHDAAAGVAAASVFVVANRLLLAPMLCFARRLRPRATGLLACDDLALELVLALVAVPVVALWERSIWLAVIALAPLVLISFTQRALHRVEVASKLISEQNEQLEHANQLVIERSTTALEALSATVDARDEYTAGHSRRVRDFAVAIGMELRLDEDALETLQQAALLHDIGKIAVPDAVLLKPGKLTQSEWQVMKSHAEEGARIIERLGYLHEVVPAIRHHHERPDGRGYPANLRGDEIPQAARIIHVADALDAMLTKRVYRNELDVTEALGEISRGSGSDFCAECVGALHRAVARGLLQDVLPAQPGVAA
jgi:putative nucleotidyltransferase with HDIG domain